MINKIRETEKALAEVKKQLASGVLKLDGIKKIAAILSDIERAEQYFNGITFRAIFHEICRDYFKLLASPDVKLERLYDTVVITDGKESPASVTIPAAPAAPIVVDATPSSAQPQAPVTAAPTPVVVAPTIANTDSQAALPDSGVYFVCKGCAKEWADVPKGGKCSCGEGGFQTAFSREESAKKHRALCEELEAKLKAPKDASVPKEPPMVLHKETTGNLTTFTIKSAPGPQATSGAEAPSAAAKTVSAPAADSGFLVVLNKDYWSCDNEKCGSDDLVHELPMPPVDKKQISSRYQCLTCGLVSQILLPYDDLVAMRGGSKVVSFKLGTDPYKLLVQQRDAPVVSETAVKVTPPVPAVLMGTTRVLVGPETIEVPVKKSRGRPKKTQEVPAQQPESFPGAAQEQSQAPVSPKLADLITKIVGYESPQIDPATITKALQTQVEVWPMEKLVKECESLTGKVWDLAKVEVPSDKNLRQVMEEAVIAEMIGKHCGVEA